MFAHVTYKAAVRVSRIYRKCVRHVARGRHTLFLALKYEYVRLNFLGILGL